MLVTACPSCSSVTRSAIGLETPTSASPVADSFVMVNRNGASPPAGTPCGPSTQMSSMTMGPVCAVVPPPGSASIVGQAGAHPASIPMTSTSGVKRIDLRPGGLRTVLVTKRFRCIGVPRDRCQPTRGRGAAQVAAHAPSFGFGLSPRLPSER
jgi:hypothetical protein